MVDHHVQNFKQILNTNLNPDFMSSLLQKLTSFPSFVYCCTLAFGSWLLEISDPKIQNSPIQMNREILTIIGNLE